MAREWYHRTTCINCFAELTRANQCFTRVKGVLYRRPVCADCHRAACAASMRRVHERRRAVELKPAESPYPQFRQWLREVMNG